MDAKEQLIDFLNYIVLLFLIAFVFLYFFLGDRLGSVAKVMQAVIPLSYFVIFFILRLKYNRRVLKKKKQEEGSTDVILVLTYRDKIIDEILIFSLPVIVVWIAYLKGVIDIHTLLQAGLVFIIMFLWHGHLFKKEE